VLRNGSGKGIQAIVVYPMNALANSQAGELEKFLSYGPWAGRDPVTFRRYTGQETDVERQAILASPPDILLTNYVMLELILTRPYESEIVRAAQGLRFLVLDELHTYRGRQGADVVLLGRRVREACNASTLQYVGTSATLAGPGTIDEQRGEVARVASLLFGAAVEPKNVIGETLRRAGWVRDGEVYRKDDERCLPLLEGKMIHLWNPRYGTYEGQTHAQANKGVIPEVDDARLADAGYRNRSKYWAAEDQVDAAWAGCRSWALGFRDIGPLERTFVITVVPKTGVGHKLPLIHLPEDRIPLALSLLAITSSFAADYDLRQRASKGQMSFFLVKQLALPHPEQLIAQAPWDSSCDIAVWLGSRAIELTHTSWLTASFARNMGYDEIPYRWTPERRWQLECELNAAVFHLYGLEHEDVEHVMDSFRLVRDEDEARLGEYRTKRVILEAYDAMSGAIATGVPYETILDPPPADPLVAHQLQDADIPARAASAGRASTASAPRAGR
jgi:hypothetical protein